MHYCGLENAVSLHSNTLFSFPQKYCTINELILLYYYHNGKSANISHHFDFIPGIVNGNCPCTSPQYLKYGKKGTIACNFTSAIDVIHWYDTNDTLHNPPVISWDKKSDDGIGFATGGYEIQPNGSLLIRDTISEGDLYFSVVMLFNELIVCAQTIHVIGFVYPHQSNYLAIDKCDGKRYCHRRVDSGSPLQLSCHLNGAVVSKPILWELWTSGEPLPLRPAGRTFSAESVGEETNMSLPYTGQLLDVLVCKIEDNFVYEVNSSTILVEWTHNNSNTQYATITPINKMAELKSMVSLDCGSSKRISFVWKMCHSENKYDCVEIMHFALENKIFLEKGLSADNSGTLFVEEVNTHHEGWYWCYSSDGRSNTERFYRLDVYAIPFPINPIVAECGDKYFCQIESGLKGNITCSLFGVRPEASLDWAVISLPSSKIISLEKKEQTVISHEGVYDISIKTLYHVESLQFSKIDLECRANVNITIMPSLSTRIQLCLSGKL
ncbi:hypothetical protein HOLleu_24946 [Holothuria leucospilota]|uniref:Ig-like domain-containing protein n=1 Tax=Holothuria leucospilota TaxID=206669 RepID=A0A9Q1H410_HOLLE|nr:hypothetical protein HOLleu_24946 [Holothuria leucospilota]